MAIHYSNEYTAASDSVHGKALGSNYTQGLNDYVLFKQYKVELPATAAADELIYVTPELPVGTIVDPTLSFVTMSADPGAGQMALDVGLVTEDDLASLISVAAGGKVDFDGLTNVTSTAAKKYVIAKLETLLESAGSMGAVDMYFTIAFRGAGPVA